MRLLAFGTTSLNHGFGDSSSANQVAVAEPTSLERLRISQSSLLLVVKNWDGIVPAYLESARQPRGDFVLGPEVVPMCSYPTLLLWNHEQRH